MNCNRVIGILLAVCFVYGADAAQGPNELFKKYVSLVSELQSKYGDNAMTDEHVYDDAFFYGQIDLCNDIAKYAKSCQSAIVINSSNTSFLNSGEQDCAQLFCNPPSSGLSLVMYNMGCILYMRNNNITCSENASDTANVDTTGAAEYFEPLVFRNSFYWGFIQARNGVNITHESSKCDYDGNKYICVNSRIYADGMGYAACGFVYGSGIGTLQRFHKLKGAKRAIIPSDVDSQCYLK